jgi:hypothetical protein
MRVRRTLDDAQEMDSRIVGLNLSTLIGERIVVDDSIGNLVGRK